MNERKSLIFDEMKRVNPSQNVIGIREYIDFCIENCVGSRREDNIEYHHILPRQTHIEYQKLNENEWNGSFLTQKNHYIAHWMLHMAQDNGRVIRLLGGS